MSDGLSLDITNFVDAVTFVEEATGRSAIDSLNRAHLHIIIGSGSYPGAMQLTPKASATAIDAVTDRQLTGFVIKKAKRKGQWPMTSIQIKAAVRRERKRRKSAIGYTAFAGWSNASQALGGRGIGRKAGFNQSQARFGSGSKASTVNPETVAVNTTPAAERIGFDALQQAIDNAAKDLVDYGTKKLQDIYDKVKP